MTEVDLTAVRDAKFAATDAMLEHHMSPAGAVCSCGHKYRRDPIGGHVPFAQIASHYAQAAVAAAAPILLAEQQAEAQRLRAAVRALCDEKSYYLDPETDRRTVVLCRDLLDLID